MLDAFSVCFLSPSLVPRDRYEVTTGFCSCVRQKREEDSEFNKSEKECVPYRKDKRHPIRGSWDDTHTFMFLLKSIASVKPCKSQCSIAKINSV